MKLIRGRRRKALGPKRQPSNSGGPKAIDPATQAAQESARQAGRGVKAAYVASALNVVVIAVALIVPAVQRSTATFEKQIDRRQQDIRAINAASSLLVDISNITGVGGMLDEDSCLQKESLNAYDQARLSLIQRRADDLRSQVFAQGAATSTQFAQEASMVRMAFSLENMRTILPTKPYSALGEGSRIAFCLVARNDLLTQAKEAKETAIAGIQVTFAPISSTLLDKDPLSALIQAQGRAMREQIENVQVSDLATEEEINKYSTEKGAVVVFRKPSKLH